MLKFFKLEYVLLIEFRIKFQFPTIFFSSIVLLYHLLFIIIFQIKLSECLYTAPTVTGLQNFRAGINLLITSAVW